MFGSGPTAGEDAPARRFSQSHFIVLFFVATLAAFAGVFSLPPLDRDEARFAQATAQMIESGDYVRIRFQEDERNKKPAGIHWLQAVSVTLFSNVEAREIWAYRLPSALAAIAASLMTYGIGSRLFDRRTGFAAGLLMCAAPLLIGEATIAKTDAALLASIVAAQAAALSIEAARQEMRTVLRRDWIAFWGAIAIGVLIKGPIAPLVLALTVGVYSAARRDIGLFVALRPFHGLIIVAAIVAPWAIAIGSATEGRFFADALGSDMAGKIGGAQEGHAGPPGLHLLLLPFLFWPAAALLPAAAAFSIRTRTDWRTAYLLAWAIPTFLLFELTTTKLPHYVLPTYPAIALLAAVAVNTATPKLNLAGAALFGVSAFAIAGGLAAIAVGVDGAGRAPSGGTLAASVLIGAAFVIAALFRQRPDRAIAAASLLSIALLWGVSMVVLPQLTLLQTSSRLSAALEAAGLHPIRNGAAAATLAGYREPSAVFLLGARTRLETGVGAAAFVGEGGAVVIEDRERDDFERTVAARGLNVRQVARLDGFNYSKGDEIVLSVYVLKTDSP